MPSELLSLGRTTTEPPSAESLAWCQDEGKKAPVRKPGFLEARGRKRPLQKERNRRGNSFNAMVNFSLWTRALPVTARLLRGGVAEYSTVAALVHQRRVSLFDWRPPPTEVISLHYGGLGA
jgi:hypothetical protein